MVGETGQVDSVLLALQFFRVFSFFCVVDLQRFVVLSNKTELSCVVKVNGCDGAVVRVGEALEDVSHY